jgi:hypothetical protein
MATWMMKPAPALPPMSISTGGHSTTLPVTGSVPGQLLREKLERHRHTELQIVGAVDLAHAAFAEQADDAVALGQHRAGREAAVTDGIGAGQPAARRRPGGGSAGQPCDIARVFAGRSRHGEMRLRSVLSVRAGGMMRAP